MKTETVTQRSGRSMGVTSTNAELRPVEQRRRDDFTREDFLETLRKVSQRQIGH